MLNVWKLDWSLNLKLQVGIWQEKMNKKDGAAKHNIVMNLSYASMIHKMSYFIFAKKKKLVKWPQT